MIEGDEVFFNGRYIGNVKDSNGFVDKIKEKEEITDYPLR